MSSAGITPFVTKIQSSQHYLGIGFALSDSKGNGFPLSGSPFVIHFFFSLKFKRLCHLDSSREANHFSKNSNPAPPQSAAGGILCSGQAVLALGSPGISSYGGGLRKPPCSQGAPRLPNAPPPPAAVSTLANLPSAPFLETACLSLPPGLCLGTGDPSAWKAISPKSGGRREVAQGNVPPPQVFVGQFRGSCQGCLHCSGSRAALTWERWSISIPSWGQQFWLALVSPLTVR